MSLVGGLIGGVIGFFTGVPQIGFAIGSAIGSTFDPNKQVEGPKITDLKIQSSQTGIIIPIVFGNCEVAGNVIWASEKREVASTESHGKGGGGGTDTTNYSYFQDFAIGLADAETNTYVGVRKIKANGKIIYNVSADADTETRASSEKIAKLLKFYPGSRTQMPDPTMDAALGVGKTPAFRGLSYVVLTNFDITPYGGQTPSFQFELIEEGPVATATSTNDYAVPVIDTHEMIWTATVTPDVAPLYPVFYSWEDMYSLEGRRAVAQAYNTQYSTGADVSSYDNWKASSISGLAMLFWPQIHGYTGITYSRSKPAGYTGEALVDAVNSALPDYEIAGGYTKKAVATKLSPPAALCSLANKTGPWQPYEGGTSFCVDAAGNVVENNTYEIVTVAAGTNEFRSLTNTGISTNLSVSTANIQGKNPVLRRGHPDFDNQTFWANEAAKAGITGTFGVDYGQLSDVACIATLGGSGIATTAAPNLDVIVAKICARAGMTAADIDVTQLADIHVPGYAVSRVSSARDDIRPLMSAYFFDGYSNGQKVIFKRRGSAPVAHIPYGDLAATNGAEKDVSKLTITRTMEDEMPQKLTVNFIDYQNSYQQGSESALRVTTKSKQQVVVDLPISLMHSTAAKIADVMLRNAFVERHRFAFSCSTAYSKYEPCDVVDVENEKGAVYRVRITKKDSTNGLIQFEAVSEDISYTSNATGGPEIIANDGLYSTGPTTFDALDIPLLQDTDNDAGFYVSLSSAGKRWIGSQVFGSMDGSSYSPTGTSTTTSAAVGTCVNALADWKGGPVFDRASALEVTMSVGELSSRSRSLILNGVGQLIVGAPGRWEVIQAMNCDLIGTNKYRLTNLLRGLHGTEQHIGTHQAGDKLIAVSTGGGFVRMPSVSGWIGTKRYFKAVSANLTLSGTAANEVVNQAVGLKPLSPVRVGGGFQTAVGGDLVMTWQRRSRIDAGMRNNVGVPLGEASESYIIEIMSGSTVKRTMQASVATVAYTEAMQIADFGAAQSDVTVNIYQVSEVVGKGFPANKNYKRA
jgi:hypothetical protein